MKLALLLIAVLALALHTFDQIAAPSQMEFLKIAREQKHTLLLLLAAQAGLIAVMTSRIAEKPVPKAATIIAGLTIFAAETSKLDQTPPTGMQVVAAVMMPIGVALTNVLPSPKSVWGKFALAFVASGIAIAGTWVISDTMAGPILGLIFGEELVFSVLAIIVVIGWIALIGSAFGLIGWVIAQNTMPSIPIQWNDNGNQRKRNRGRRRGNRKGSSRRN